jgi:putative ABC transport system substrate-binding protein
MNRRHAAALVAAAIAGALTTLFAQDAQPRVRRIGYLGPTRENAPNLIDAFRQGLRDAGYEEGRNISVIYRWTNAEGFEPVDENVLLANARDLVAADVEAIAASIDPAVLAARKATDRIPIVMMNVGDPIALGVIASIKEPGGNVTGITRISSELVGKTVQLLLEVVPSASEIHLLVNETNRNARRRIDISEQAAKAVGKPLRVQTVAASSALEAAFAELRRHRARALLVADDGMFFTRRQRIADLLLDARLPAMFTNSEFVEAGGLIAYSANSSANYRRAGSFIDRILRGERPGQMAVEQAPKFELVVNERTAERLNITIPATIRASLDYSYK